MLSLRIHYMPGAVLNTLCLLSLSILLTLLYVSAIGSRPISCMSNIRYRAREIFKATQIVSGTAGISATVLIPETELLVPQLC